MLAYTVILFFFGYSFISPPFMCAPYIEFRITSGQGSVICWAGSFSPVLWDILLHLAQRIVHVHSHAVVETKQRGHIVVVREESLSAVFAIGNQHIFYGDTVVRQGLPKIFLS